MRISDWSSDVCSSDLDHEAAVGGVDHVGEALERVDQLDLMAELQVQIVQHLPLRDGLRGVGGLRRLHPRVDLVADREVRSEERRVGKECVSTVRSWW